MRTSTETIIEKYHGMEKYHGISVDGNHGLGGTKVNGEETIINADDWCGVVERAGYISQKSFNEEPVRLHNVDTLANPLPTTASLSSVGVKN